jgi:hypothetical protein
MRCRTALLTIGLLATFLAAPSSVFAADAAQPDDEGFISLFDGKTLDGWKVNEHPESAKVEDGAIVIGGGPTAHVFYEGPVESHDFTNFHLKLQVNTKPGSNSGVYFHTKFQEEGWPDQGYEAQVNNAGDDPRKTGSLYGVKDVDTSLAKDNEWFDYLITVEGNHITTAINGEKVVDFTESGDEMPHLKEFPGRKLSRGTIALQAHDPGSIVHYKDIQIRLLP